MKPKIACVFPPNLGRGMRLIGASLCLYDWGLQPEMITACSAGANAGASVLGWNRDVLENAVNTWSGLTPRDIWQYKLADRALLVSPFVNAALHLIPELGRHSKMERLARAGISLSTTLASAYAVLHQKSFFSNEPLRRLLLENLRRVGCDKIFGSKTKFIAISAEKNSGGRRLHTNFESRDMNLARFVSGIIASSAIPGYFPPEKMDGEELIDGIFSNEDFLGLDLIENFCARGIIGCDYILVFRFYGVPQGSARSALKIIDQSNELRVRDGINYFLSSPRLSPETKNKIVVVDSEKTAKKISLYDFSAKDSRDAIEDGYAAAEKVLKEICS